MSTKYQFCPHCGAKNDVNNEFCVNCGKTLSTHKPHSSQNITPSHVKNDYPHYRRKRSPLLIIVVIIIAIFAVSGVSRKLYQHHEHAVYVYQHPAHQLPPSITNRHYSFQNGSKFIMHKNTFTYVGAQPVSGNAEKDDTPDSDTPGAYYFYRVNSVNYQNHAVLISCHFEGSEGARALVAGDLQNGHTAYRGVELTVKGHQVTNEQLVRSYSY